MASKQAQKAVKDMLKKIPLLSEQDGFKWGTP